MVSKPYCMSGRKNAATFRFLLPASSPAATVRESSGPDTPTGAPVADAAESNADQKLCALPWQQVAEWLRRLDIDRSVIQVIEKERLPGIQIASMDLEELISDLSMSKLQARRVLKRWKIFETITHVTAHALTLQDSDLSDAPTLEGEDSSEESDSAEEDHSHRAIAAKHSGQPEHFQAHMKGFVKDLLDFLSAGDPDEGTEHYSVQLSESSTSQWTFCMIVWLWFAKEADFDERTRQVWLDRICSGSGCTQQRLLECLEGCLQYCGTAHKQWSSDAFSQLGCTKSGAAGVFVTDRMVQHLLRGHPTSCEEWKVSVVRGWFGNEEQPSAFLLRANAFLRQHLIDGTQVLEAVVKTRSFVSFIFATRLASLLLFAYLEARKLSAATDAAAGATVKEPVFGGFSAFVSSDKLVFRTSEARHPCRVALPLVCQGLRCLAQVPPRLREMLGPTQAMFALEADRQAVQVPQAELLATGSKKLNKGDRADDEVESPAAEKRTPESTAAERKVLREYLRSMLARTEAVRDSASGEEHKI
eukprot:2147783-Rhodomonas_salina.1